MPDGGLVAGPAQQRLGRDHLLGSIDLLASKYAGAEYLGYRPERVDLITPARVAGSRFGAIAVYLGYKKKADKAPSFYMFEAGTASGDAKMIYFSPSFAPIKNATSYYLPTPFVSMRNTYSGYVKMRPAPDEDEPEKLFVESRAVGEQDPYFTVTVSYERQKEMDVPIPAELLVRTRATPPTTAQPAATLARLGGRATFVFYGGDPEEGTPEVILQREEPAGSGTWQPVTTRSVWIRVRGSTPSVEPLRSLPKP